VINRDPATDLIMKLRDDLPDAYEALHRVLTAPKPSRHRVLTVACPGPAGHALARVYRVPTWKEFPPVVLAVERATQREVTIPGGLLITGKGRMVEDFEREPSWSDPGQHPGFYYAVRSRASGIAGWLGAGVSNWEFQCRCHRRSLDEREVLGWVAAGRRRVVP
jgi:hypothetical protein